MTTLGLYRGFMYLVQNLKLASSRPYLALTSTPLSLYSPPEAPLTEAHQAAVKLLEDSHIPLARPPSAAYS